MTTKPVPETKPKQQIIASYTPSLMGEETLRAIFVARQPLLDRLVRDIRDSATSRARRHALLIGPRGMGKTHLISMVYYAVRDDTRLYRRLRVAWLREEEWSVFSFADLLVRIFRALANEYPDERKGLNEFAETLRRLPVDEGEEVGTAELLRFLDKRLLLLIAENVNDLFEGMGEEGQQSLRAFLQTHSKAVLLTTSPALTPDLSAHAAPFYGFFNTTHLKELTRDEARELLIHVAREINGDDELAAYLETPEADQRLRVIEALAGGHPRIWILFSECLSKQLLDDLVPLFVKMLDDLTPYYQERMRALPPQERQIVVFLCEKSGAIPVKEIAEACRLKPPSCAVQLGRLEEKAYVRVAPALKVASGGDGRVSYYEMREPLMRLCLEVKESRAIPLTLIVEFLRLWFGEEKIRERLALLPADAVLTHRYLTAALERAREIRQNTFSPLLPPIKDAADTERILRELADEERAVQRNPNDAMAWRNRGVSLAWLERYEESLQSYDRALKLNDNDALTWLNRGVSLFQLGRYHESLESYDRAVELEPYSGGRHANRASLLALLHRFDESLKALTSSLRLVPRSEDDWRMNAQIFIMLLLLSTERREQWGGDLSRLTELFAEQEALSLLSKALTDTLPILFDADVTDETAHEWLSAWEQAAETHPEMDVAMRLLRATVEWKRTRDRGALLRLASEERAVLEDLLLENGIGVAAEEETTGKTTKKKKRTVPPK